MTGKLMLEPVGLEFRAVHKDYSHLGVRIYGVFIVCLLLQFLPVAEGRVDFFRFDFKRIYCFHLIPPVVLLVILSAFKPLFIRLTGSIGTNGKFF